MFSNSREKGNIQAKQEGETKFSKAAAAAASGSRQWPGFKNPRIVRVSRSFGGKDRHSKVSTIRGLRDRRIRLSVPTAVQLYDLQERLGLSQPSKVIDWLLDAAKHDIDQLPPLQVLQGFGQFHQQLLSHDQLNASHHPHHQSPLASLFNNSNSNPTFMNGDIERGSIAADKGKWINTNEQEIQDGFSAEVSAVQKLFPMTNNSSYFHSADPSSFSLSQFGSHGIYPSQILDLHHTSNAAVPVPLPSSLPVPSGSQLFFCPSSTPALFTPFPSYITTPAESDPMARQFNHFQQHFPHHSLVSALHSVNSPSKSSFLANSNPGKLPQSQNANGSKLDKDNNTGS